MVTDIKTNVMRILDAKHISYIHYTYTPDATLTGVDIAKMLNQDLNQVFKTLVTVARSGKYYVFMIPVGAELDLKHAALSVGEKAIDMLKSRDLLGLTGYVHGGCSPIGMKKQFVTVVDASAQNFDSIIFSGGRIGHQVHVALSDLSRVAPIRFASLCVD